LEIETEIKGVDSMDVAETEKNIKRINELKVVL
jgi:hypothetical protein